MAFKRNKLPIISISLESKDIKLSSMVAQGVWTRAVPRHERGMSKEIGFEDLNEKHLQAYALKELSMKVIEPPSVNAEPL